MQLLHDSVKPLYHLGLSLLLKAARTATPCGIPPQLKHLGRRNVSHVTIRQSDIHGQIKGALLPNFQPRFVVGLARIRRDNELVEPKCLKHQFSSWRQLTEHHRFSCVILLQTLWQPIGEVSVYITLCSRNFRFRWHAHRDLDRLQFGI